MKAECRQRLKDLADAEVKPVAASPHTNDTEAAVPLQCLLQARDTRQRSS